MDSNTKTIIWGQFGAAIDTLENAIAACPDDLWGDRSRYHQFWYVTYHTLFWLDYYSSDDPAKFAPPAPFGLEEMDPAGLLPDRVYSKDELLEYLEYGRTKCRQTISDMTDERAGKIYEFQKANLTFVELLFYIMRHVQHHAAQLHLILRLETDSAPGWVFKAKDELE